MPGYLQFRDDRDEVVSGILHDLLYLFLRIIPAMLCSLSFDTFGGNLLEFRIFLNLYAPALIVSQVPMQAIYLEQRQHIDELLHALHRHKVPTGVQHNATIAETRRIFHTHQRRLPSDAVHLLRALNLSRKELHEGLHTVEESLSGLRRNACALLSHLQSIAFVVRYIGSSIKAQRNVSLLCHLDIISRSGPHLSRKELGNGLSLRRCCPERGPVAQLEITVMLH